MLALVMMTYKHQILPNFCPLKQLCLHRFFIRQLKPSAAIRNRKGDRGSPCLKPFSSWNSFVGLPFIRIAIEAEDKQFHIHFLHFQWKFMQDIISSKYFHNTESYVFSKSTLNKRAFHFSIFMKSVATLRIKMLSKIYLFPTKALWFFWDYWIDHSCQSVC